MSVKTIIVDMRSTPDLSGYHDRVTVLYGDEHTYRYHGDYSTCPNPYRPSDHAMWTEAYGWVGEPGHYRWTCEIHPQRGKVLRLSDPTNAQHPERLQTVNENRNHDGQLWADGVLVHEGYGPVWRGSAACHTVPPGPPWGEFISLFDVGETGDYIVTKQA